MEDKMSWDDAYNQLEQQLGREPAKVACDIKNRKNKTQHVYPF
jgi:hypothetical protein